MDICPPKLRPAASLLSMPAKVTLLQRGVCVWRLYHKRVCWTDVYDQSQTNVLLGNTKRADFAYALVCRPNESEFQKLANKLVIRPAVSFKHYVKIRRDGNRLGIVILHTLMITLQNKEGPPMADDPQG